MLLKPKEYNGVYHNNMLKILKPSTSDKCLKTKHIHMQQYLNFKKGTYAAYSMGNGLPYMPLNKQQNCCFYIKTKQKNFHLLEALKKKSNGTCSTKQNSSSQKSYQKEQATLTHVANCANSASDGLPWGYLYCKAQVRYSNVTYNWDKHTHQMLHIYKAMTAGAKTFRSIKKSESVKRSGTRQEERMTVQGGVDERFCLKYSSFFSLLHPSLTQSYRA